MASPRALSMWNSQPARQARRAGVARPRERRERWCPGRQRCGAIPCMCAPGWWVLSGSRTACMHARCMHARAPLTCPLLAEARSRRTTLGAVRAPLAGLRWGLPGSLPQYPPRPLVPPVRDSRRAHAHRVVHACRNACERHRVALAVSRRLWWGLPGSLSRVPTAAPHPARARLGVVHTHTGWTGLPTRADGAASAALGVCVWR